MPLPGGSTTRIKRCQSIWSNHTPRSMSIRRAMVHFGGMGSPNIYLPEIAATTAGPLPIEVLNGNVLGGDITPASLDGTPLPFMYCVDASRDIFVPGTYAATVTSNGTIHGTAVAHADQVAWLLGQYATDASGNATKTAALQAAIWEVMYGNQFTLHSPTAVVIQEALYLTHVGTAPVSNYTWISPVSGTTLMQGQVTRVPEPSGTLLLGLALSGVLALGWWRRQRTT